MHRSTFGIAGLALALATAPAPAQVPTATSDAKTVMSRLAGTWQFALYQNGRNTPVSTGRREMHLLADSLKLAWTETFDGRVAGGSGFLGYDDGAGAFYLMGVQAGVRSPMFLVGHAGDGAIHFDPAASPAGLANRPGVYVASSVRMVDRDHFEWLAADGRWRVEFTRVAVL
jgi:hypothetical protein